MYYLYINDGIFISHFRTLKGMMEYIAERDICYAYGASIMEGLHGEKYHICPITLQSIAEQISAGDSLVVQALGESVDINDYTDLADLLRKYKTERLYVDDFDIIHSSGECIDTVYRQIYNSFQSSPSTLRGFLLLLLQANKRGFKYGLFYDRFGYSGYYDVTGRFWRGTLGSV